MIMKTSVNMIRKMGNFEVTQRTKDSMFNATELLKQWNKSHNVIKKVGHFLDLEQTKQFLQELDNEVSRDCAFYIERNKTSKTGVKKSGNTWMHPFLFIDFAMWINPKFKLEVIKFVYDQLIEFRHDAGDMYKGLTNALSKFKNANYPEVAKALNWIVFDKHESGIRQTATPGQLKELTDLQKTLAFSLDMNYIKSYKQLINEMRRLYHMKSNKF